MPIPPMQVQQVLSAVDSFHLEFAVTWVRRADSTIVRVMAHDRPHGETLAIGVGSASDIRDLDDLVAQLQEAIADACRCMYEVAVEKDPF